MKYLGNNKTPLIAAHRGLSGGNIPCNTESSYKAALFHGADIIEIDVSISLDKELFVFHPTMEFAHLGSSSRIPLMTSEQVAECRFITQDNVSTNERVLTLDDALELLKDKCIVNVDKFWSDPERISKCIRRHNMEDQVILKTPLTEDQLQAVEEFAPDMAYMPIISEVDNVSKELMKRKINYIGIEALFERDDAQIASDEHIEWLHKNGLIIWGNAIIYDTIDILSGGHSDDVAVTGNPDYGWGWFKDKNFDIVQTDWLPSLKQYYEKSASSDK